MLPAPTLDRETLQLWHALGWLYSRVTGAAKRATMSVFAIVCISGALVLLSGFFFGTAWAGATPRSALVAALLPVLAGVLAGAVLFGWERAKFRRQREALRKVLAVKGEDASRPALRGLQAYHDAQLVLLRSEYELLRQRGSERTARIFEDTFGFTPEDEFETGPLNVSPHSDELRLLRRWWERRISMRRERGMEPPAMGLKEDSAYKVFPREMSEPVELETRKAYLTISCGLIEKRYGKNPLKNYEAVPAGLRDHVERDLREHAALNRTAGWPRPGAG